MSFKDNLATGMLGEGLIAKWLQAKGWNVLPAYEIEIASGKGPRLYLATKEQFITPDLLVFRSSEIRWVEAKTKSAFTWHRISESWQTGIDLRHWRDYIKVGERTSFPLWLMFLHKPGNVAKDTPEGKISPHGIFGQEIEALKESIDHEDARWGPSGMVYWKVEALARFGDYPAIS
jgi:hypothetical protein